MLGGRTLRVDLHPADLERPRQMLALDRVLDRAGHRREAITYDELAEVGAAPAPAPLPAGPASAPATGPAPAGSPAPPPT